jgi:hypothetical protein
VRLLLALIVVTAGCSGTPTAPAPVALVGPLLLAGQSNALYLGNVLGASLRPDTSLQEAELAQWRIVVQAGLPISVWNPGTPGAAMLETAVAGTRGLVWWQGESDAMACNPHYAQDLRALLARLRQHGWLSVAIVQIGNLDPSALQAATQLSVWSCWQAVRADLVAVSHDPDTRLIDTDDAPLQPNSLHFTDAGYRLVADRIRGMMF